MDDLDETEPQPRSSRIDWNTLLTTDFGDVEWTTGKLMTKGQQIALVGDGKAGKSVLCQEWAWRMAAGKSFLGDQARPPARILYLDRENGQDDLQKRFLSFGATTEELANLSYESFPVIPNLDTPAGGAALMALVEDTGAEIVWIDTVSRFITGAENDSDTWLALYRCSLSRLKANGIGSVRLDHFGKDKERGSRGSSAKTQDVDHVWELVVTDKGGNLLQLRRTHTRTGVGEDLYTIRRLGERTGDVWQPGKTRHVLADTSMPSMVEDLIRKLDDAGIPANYGRDKVRTECANRGISLPRNDVLTEVLRIRKTSKNLSRDLGDRSENQTCPGCRDSFEVSAGHTCPGQLGDRSGQAEAGPVPLSPPLRGGQVVRMPRPTETTAHKEGEIGVCDWCGETMAKLAPDQTAHIGCGGTNEGFTGWPAGTYGHEANGASR